MAKLNCLLVAVSFSFSSIVFAIDDAAVTTNMTAQKTECDANTAMEWSSTLSRCIGKQTAIDTRNAAKACDSLTDATAKEKCHISVTEKSTGLSADTSKLNQGNTTGSMIMNGIGAAYTIINMISGSSKDGANSNCASKKIFGITSVAGLASDVFLKMKAKKKVRELESKYKLDTTSGSYEAQVKALEYLKEEQQTVVSIASMEKKRNLMLMLGYGLAAGWAAYEMTPFGANPNCVPGEEKKAAADKVAGDNPTTEVTGKADPDAAKAVPEPKVDTPAVDKGILDTPEPKRIIRT